MKIKLNKEGIIGLAIILLIISNYFAFYRGKRQANLECIDFNVMSIIDNTITITICALLSITSLWLWHISKPNKSN